MTLGQSPQAPAAVYAGAPAPHQYTYTELVSTLTQPRRTHADIVAEQNETWLTVFRCPEETPCCMDLLRDPVGVLSDRRRWPSYFCGDFMLESTKTPILQFHRTPELMFRALLTEGARGALRAGADRLTPENLWGGAMRATNPDGAFRLPSWALTNPGCPERTYSRQPAP